MYLQIGTSALGVANCHFRQIPAKQIHTLVWAKTPANVPAPRRAILPNDLKSELIALLPRLRRFALTLTRGAADADDLVQEACLAALRSAEKWDQSKPLDRWVFTILRNCWINEVRKRKVRQGEGTVPAETAEMLIDSNTGEEALKLAQLKSKIFALPDDLSSVLLLVSIEGYSYAETAQLLDIPIGTIMSRVHRARKTLAALLNSEQGGAQ